jgi:hypothetical protein
MENLFEEGSYAAQMLEAAINVITPVMESTAIYAGKYANACGRDFITGEDMKYAMRYCARTMVGKHSGSLFPEIYDEESSDEEDEIEVIEEDEEHCFVRYTGDDELMNEINEAYDTWDEWEPHSPIEKMLQDAVNKNNE